MILQIAKTDNLAGKNLYLTYRAHVAVLARVEPWLDAGNRRDRARRSALKEDGAGPAVTAWMTEAVT